MKIIAVSFYICLALSTCSCSSSGPHAPTPVAGDAGVKVATDAAASSPAPRPAIAQPERKRPPHTFDLLSAPVDPGATTTQQATLPAGWAVTGMPQIVGGGFAIVKAETVRAPAQPDIYQVTARNIGKTTARFVADVPCSGCP